MPANVLTGSMHTRLVRDIRALLAEGRTRAQEAVNQQLVNMYWQIGKRLAREDLDRTTYYGQSILQDLAAEFDMNLRTLERSIAFFKAYNSAPRGRNLTWSHYRELMKLPDPRVRKDYGKLVETHGWTRDQLMKAIRENRHLADGAAHGRALSPQEGSAIKRPTKPSFVYKALVERVVDGDTLLLRIDLGFQVWKEQRIRLAEIDAEPLDTDPGRKAFEFVRDTLARLPFVMVKTNKIDIYGRYIGHVFYSFEEKDRDRVFQEGKYLNQELLDRKLAKVF